MTPQFIVYSHLFRKQVRPITNICVQAECSGYTVWMENIVLYIQVVKKSKILKDESDVSNTEITPRFITLLGYFQIMYPNTSLFRDEDSGNQVQQSGLS